MLRTADYVTTVCIVLLGTVHTTLTPLFYQDFSLGALWFAGSGLALIFAGFLNIIRIKIPETMIIIFCIIVNLMMLIFCVVAAILIRQFQAYTGLFLIMSALLFSVKCLFRFKLSER